ncbi:MAG: DEAD/DEAH box helicase [Deltaproteobacteria bacterium]|nr:DEAD/DEAH box helicase [Deltaproteobacteria bacterium]
MTFKRYPPRGRHRTRRGHHSPRIQIKPGADKRLNRIFSKIGVPEKHPFIPDSYQNKAVSAIRKGDCLVTAPTGSGKTWIAVQAISDVFKNNGRAWYASPLKALTNSKYTEFSAIFGKENVGILTGDRKENPDAPIIVGTTEILRNQLYDAMYRGRDLETDLVVLDEAHYIGDPDRGVVWEETMIYLPSRIPLLMLSATIGNAHKIAEWLESIRKKPCGIIEEKKRAVPLFPLFLHPSGTLYPLLGEMEKKGKKRLYKKVIAYLKQSDKPRFGGQLPRMDAIAGVLTKYNLLPAIFFLKSRADCDSSVAMCENHFPREDIERKNGRIARIKELCETIAHVKNHRHMGLLRKKGVAAHHSGQLPGWKLLVETLMTEGYLDAVFATSTVAAGVNFPARTILFLNSDRFNGRDFIPLDATQFHQMTGRAGRRGKDMIGFAVVIPGRFMDTHFVARLIHAPPSDVESQIRLDFSMTLNLIMSHSPVQIHGLLDKSFAAFLYHATRSHGRNPSDQKSIDSGFLWREFLRHLDFLKEKSYVTSDNRLTESGVWGSKLRIDHPLMVAEGLRRELFPDSTPSLLAGIMASFVNERDMDDESLKSEHVPDALINVFERIASGLEPFAKELITAGFNAPHFFLKPAAVLYYWAQGGAWDDTIAIWSGAEGDLAMLILRTADNLRHIASLSDVFPVAAETARTAVNLILREPVVPSLIQPTPYPEP